MNILILFFSGTGNTQYIAQYIYTHLQNRLDLHKNSITISSIEKIESSIINDNYDLLILGFPVYAGFAPKNVTKFVDSIPPIRNKGVFTFNTKGLAEGYATRNIINHLEKGGFKPIGYTSIKMPGSDGLAMMKKDGNVVKYINKDYDNIKKTNKFIDEIVEKIQILNNGSSIEEIPRKKPLGIIGFIFSGFLKGMYGLMENWMKKKFYADDRCTKCGICAKNCPTNNITINDSVVFSDKCIICLRCLHNCPEEAIQLANLTIDKFRWHGPKNNFNPSKYKKPIKITE